MDQDDFIRQLGLVRKSELGKNNNKDELEFEQIRPHLTKALTRPIRAFMKKNPKIRPTHAAETLVKNARLLMKCMDCVVRVVPFPFLFSARKRLRQRKETREKLREKNLQKQFKELVQGLQRKPKYPVCGLITKRFRFSSTITKRVLTKNIGLLKKCKICSVLVPKTEKTAALKEDMLVKSAHHDSQDAKGSKIEPVEEVIPHPLAQRVIISTGFSELQVELENMIELPMPPPRIPI